MRDAIFRAAALRAEAFRLRLTQTWVREAGRLVVLAGHAGPRLDET